MDKNNSKPVEKGASTSKPNEITEFEEGEIDLNLELEEDDEVVSKEKSEKEKSDSKTSNSKNISGTNNEKESTRAKSKENIQEGSLKLEKNNETKSELETSKSVSAKLKKQQKPNSSVQIEEEQIEIEDTELEDKLAEGTLKLEERSKGAVEDEETAVPLLVGESVSINMQGESPSEQLHTGVEKEEKPKKNESLFSHSPIARLRSAWEKSTNVFDFLLRVVLIVFSTLGWILCSGGLPLVAIAMFIIGSVYIDDCKVQPNIPLYLIVSGVVGTIQHFVAFWPKCVPESRQERLSRYKKYYRVIDGAIQFLLLIWFIQGCVWVYGVKDVEFQDELKDEYCHKTVYYFAFWLLNISFILIAFIAVVILGLLLVAICS